MGLEQLASRTTVQEESPSVRTVNQAQTAVLLAQGITLKGPMRVATKTTSYDDFVKKFGAYMLGAELPLQVRQFFLNGGGEAWISRVTHYTDNTDPATKQSDVATGTLQTAAGAETQGEVTCGNAEPYALDNGLTLVVRGNNDGAAWGPTTVTFDAVAGYAVTNEAGGGGGGAEPFALVNGDTLIIAVDGGADQTITFDTGEFVDIGAATAEEVAAVINGELVGAHATVTGAGTTVTITSDTKGTGSIIDVDALSTAIVGTKLDMSSGTGGTHTGTGDFANAAAATAAEVAAAIEGSGAGASLEAAAASGYVRLRSNGFGSDSNIKVDSGTANTALGFDTATHTGYASGATNTLQVDGKYDGAYANGYTITVQAATSGVATEFNLVVYDAAGIIREVFANLSMVDTDTRYVETVVNHADSGSIWITVTDLDAARLSQRPANGSVVLSGGDDGLGSLADSDFIGSEAGQTGLYAFDEVATGTLLISPDRAVVAVQNAMITYAEITRNLQLLTVLDAPSAYDEDSIVSHMGSLTGSECFAIYWPRVTLPNPSTAVYGLAANLTVPPSGSLAGMYARSDRRKEGPFAQPTGPIYGVLYGISGLENTAVQRLSVRNKVAPALINTLVFTKGTGVHPDETLVGKEDGNFPSIGERRGASWVEMTLRADLDKDRNQNNTPELRAKLRRGHIKWLNELVKAGCFASTNPAEAYYLDIDVPGVGLNNAAVVRAKQLFERVGLATAAPARFITLLVTRDTRALDEQAQSSEG